MSPPPPTDGVVRFRWGAATDVGRVRRVNQDRFLARDGLFVVADGMGGHQGGETASRLAVEAVEGTFADGDLRSLVASVHAANERILSAAGTDADLAGMGTTLCALALVEGRAPEPTRPIAVVDPSTVDPSTVDDVAPADGSEDGAEDGAEDGPVQLRLAVANVGDSRVYRFADDALEQITLDHSLVEELVRAGRLSPDEAHDHPQRNILTRALGVSDDLQLDMWELALRAGDRFVLCSDGLFNEVTDSRIAATLRRLEDPEHAAGELVRMANDHGSRDNVTVIVVNVDAGTAAADELGVGRSAGAPAVIDLAGFSRAVDPHEAGDPHDADDPAPARTEPAPDSSVGDTDGDTDGATPHRRARHRRIGVGTVVFVALVLGVVAAGAVAVGIYARSNYFVGVQDDELVVFQGRPGGVLWFDPTVADRTGVTTDELTPALLEEALAEPQYPSAQEALDYVQSLVERIPTPEPRPTPVPTPTPTPPVTPLPTPTSIADGPPTPTSIAQPTPTSIADGTG